MATPSTPSSSSSMDVANITQLSDFLQHFTNKDEVSNIVESITYNVHSQTIIIQMARLLKTEADTGIGRGRAEVTGDDELRSLSERYRKIYPTLLNHFKNWKTCREDLIQTSNTCADSIDRYFTLISGFRMITSVVDTVGIVTKFQKSGSPWLQLLIENASTFGLVSRLIEETLVKQNHSKTKKAIKKDQETFKEIKKCLEQSEELNTAVKRFFPYGIDEDLVRQIDKSSDTSDNFVKIFMSVLASNAGKDVNLFTDINFLSKAKKFATSDVGIAWFQKVTLPNNPNFSEALKSEINEEIKELLSSTGKEEFAVNASLILSYNMSLRIISNALTFFSAANNLWDESDNSEALRSLAQKLKAELEAMKSVLKLLKPSETELDETLI